LSASESSAISASSAAQIGTTGAPSLAARLQEAGAAAVGIHPRTAEQGWRGKADHGVTAALAEALKVPVIASGDITGLSAARHLMEGCGARAVMVGRAALGNPWLFADLLSGGEPHRRPLEEVLEEMEHFYRDVVDEMGDRRAVRYMRKFYNWYLGPFKPSAELRKALLLTESFQDAAGLAAKGLKPAG